MDAIKEIFISLGLNSDDVGKGMKQAESTISSGIKSITGHLSVLSGAITSAFAVGMAFNQYTAEADAMGKLADSLDINIEKLHAWSETAARAGGSAGAFQSSLQSLTGQLARTALTGSSRAKSVLEGAGIDAGDIGRQRDAFEVMEELAEKAETMGKAEFLGLGRSLGLDTGTIMMLQQGRQALKDAIQAQKEFGVYTKEDAKATADFNDRMADFGQVVRSVSAIAFRMILPPLTMFMEKLNQVVAFIRKHEKFVQAFFVGLAAVITAYAIPALYAMAAAMFANPFAWVVAGLVVLAAVIEDLIVWAEGGDSAFKKLWESFLANDKVQRIIAALGQLYDEFYAFGRGIVVSIQGAMDKVGDILNRTKESFNNFCEMIKSAVGAAFDWIADKFNAVFAPIKSFLNFLGNGVSVGTPSLAGVGGYASASDALYGGGSVSNFGGDRTVETNVNVGTVNIQAQDGRDGANQFMGGVESSAARWTSNADYSMD